MKRRLGARAGRHMIAGNAARYGWLPVAMAYGVSEAFGVAADISRMWISVERQVR